MLKTNNKMPLKQITFSKKYPYAQFLNYDIGYVWELSDGETNEEIEEKLLQMAENHHRTHHPHLYQEQDTTQQKASECKFMEGLFDYKEKVNAILYPKTPQPIENQQLTQEQKIHNLIIQSTSIPELEQYKLLSNNKKYPSLKEAWDNKLNELTK